MIIKDNIHDTNMEISVLENLLQDAYLKRRDIMKQKGLQTWWDFFLEWMGY